MPNVQSDVDYCDNLPRTHTVTSNGTQAKKGLFFFFFPCLVLTGLEHLILLWSQGVCSRAVVVLDHLHLDLC